jgi:hypothetical protein
VRKRERWFGRWPEQAPALRRRAPPTRSSRTTSGCKHALFRRHSDASRETGVRGLKPRRYGCLEEGEDVFGGHGAGASNSPRFWEKRSLPSESRTATAGTPRSRGTPYFFGNVEILVHFADVDVDHKEELVEGGSDFGRVEGFVENVAIEAPVAAKDDQDAFAEGGRGIEGFGDFLAGIGVSGIDVLLVERLAKTGSNGVLRRHKQPFVALIKPTLGHDDVFTLRRSAGLVGERELQDQDVDVGLWVLLLGDFGGKVDESFGFKSGPESDFVRERDGILFEVGDLEGGRLRVQSLKSGEIAREDGGAPSVERREGWRSELAGGDAGREKRQENE